MAGLTDLLASRGLPGAAACVVRDGRVVDEAVTGTVDGVRPWTPDTLVMTYSVAKPFAALVVLTAVRDGALALDQPVREVWPEYASATTTVRHVLSHQAGVPAWTEPAAWWDRETLVAQLASATPVHEPGTACAEHALTYGHLCDELVRRATGLDLASSFAGLAGEHDWDVHLRVAPADLDRVADVVPLGDWPARYTADPRWGPAMAHPAGTLDPAVLNSERWRTTPFAAINAHASARGLATFYGHLYDGTVAVLLGRKLWREYVGPQVTGHDLLLDREVTWTLGFQVDDVDLGMGGAGGCSAGWSFRAGCAVAYVTRGLGDHETAEAVWELAEAL